MIKFRKIFFLDDPLSGLLCAILLFIFGNQIIWAFMALLYQFLAQCGIGPALPTFFHSTSEYAYWIAFPFLVLIWHNAYILFLIFNFVHYMLRKKYINILQMVSYKFTALLIALTALLGYLIGKILPYYILGTDLYSHLLILYTYFWLYLTYFLAFNLLKDKKIKLILLMSLQMILTGGSLWFGSRLLHYFYQKLAPHGHLIYISTKLQNEIFNDWYMPDYASWSSRYLFYVIMVYFFLLMQFMLLFYLSSKWNFKNFGKTICRFSIFLLLLFFLSNFLLYILGHQSERVLASAITLLEKKQNRTLSIASLQNSIYNGEIPDKLYWDKICKMTMILSCKDQLPVITYHLNENQFPEEIINEFSAIIQRENKEALSDLEKAYSFKIPPSFCRIDERSISVGGAICLLRFFKAEADQIESLINDNKIHESIDKLQLLHKICCQLRFGGTAEHASIYFRMLQLTAESRNRILKTEQLQENQKSQIMQSVDEEIAVFETLKEKFFNDLVIEYLIRADYEGDLKLSYKRRFLLPAPYWSRLQLKLNLAKMFLQCSSFEELEIQEKRKSALLYCPFYVPLSMIHPLDRSNQRLFFVIHELTKEHELTREYYLSHKTIKD